LALAISLALGLFFFRLGVDLRNANDFAVAPSYRRADNWLASAKCAQERRVLLVQCRWYDGQLVPLSLDDHGSALLVGLVALLTPQPPDRVTLVKINLLTNAVGLLLFGLILWLGQSPWTAATLLLVGPMLLPPHNRGATWYMEPDVTASYAGIYLLALLLAAWLACARGRGVFSPLFLGVAGLGLLALGGAMLLRQPIGMIGVFCATGLLVVWFVQALRAKDRVSALGCVGLAILTLAQLYVPRMVLRANEIVFDLPRSPAIAEHGISHNLYLGLGSEPNPWGIVWRDAYGHQAVAERDPKAACCSAPYFDTLWTLYLEKVREDPGTVAKIYLEKARKVLWMPLEGWPGRTLHYFLLLLAMLGALWWRGKRDPTHDQGKLTSATALAVALVLFLLQGVLAVPEARYLYPAQLGVLVPLLLVAEGLLNRIRPWPPVRGSAGCG
jgi:hypothetical protein